MNYWLLLPALAVALMLLPTTRKLRKRWRTYRKQQRTIRNALGFWIQDSMGNSLLIRQSDKVVERQLLRDREWEPEITALLRLVLKPNQRAVALGTHIGVHFVNMAKKIGPGGHIWGFEPNPETKRMLEVNILLNDLKNATVVPKAAYDHNGTIAFVVERENSGRSHIIINRPDLATKQSAESASQVIKVETVCVDDALSDVAEIDLLMMDIEGAEPRALRGAQELIKRSPNLLILQEWHPGMMRDHMPLDEYHALLKKHQFSFFFEIFPISKKRSAIRYIADPTKSPRLDNFTNVLISRDKEFVARLIKDQAFLEVIFD